MSGLNKHSIIGVVGAGTMGRGIAQVAALAGHRVKLLDIDEASLTAGVDAIRASLVRNIPAAEVAEIMDRIVPIGKPQELSDAGLIIEAIVEKLEVKQALFTELESVVSEETILASNTSSISITAIFGGLKHPERGCGMHFFIPAHKAPLVEVIASDVSARSVLDSVYAIAKQWGKVPVKAVSSPGFIVNRIARPYYAEALRMLEEGIADVATVDACLRSSGFKMGPFELMDFIGNDVNYLVTKTVWEQFYYDERFKPSQRQLELVMAKRWGRKTGRGFYSYPRQAETSSPEVYKTESPVRVYQAQGLSSEDHKSRLSLRSEPSDLVGRLPSSWEVNSLEPEEQHLRFGGDVIEYGEACIVITDGRRATEISQILGDNLILVDRPAGFAWEGARDLAVAKAPNCSDKAFEDARRLLSSAGFNIHPIKDVPGLIVARTVAMIINFAYDAWDNQIASKEDIDLGMKYGVAYPFGPFEWFDESGIVTRECILNTLLELREYYDEGRYRLAPCLVDLAEWIE